MSYNLVIPSVKYVFVSYYLVISGCRVVCGAKYGFSSIDCNEKFRFRRFSSYNFSNVFVRKRPEEPPWRILFFGTDQFSLACLQPLNAKLNTGTLLSGLGIVTQTGSAIYKFADSEKLPIYSWPPDDSVLNDYDMGIVVSYGKLIPKNIIDALPLGILNVHGSLLPRWRGAAPIAYAIMNGDTETGVTIMKIKPHKFDVGDMVRQYRCSVSPNEMTPELTKRLAKNAGLLLMECIRDLPRCLDMATPQPEEGVTYAPKISAKLAVIDWKKLSAKKVYDLHRAISYKYPLQTTWQNKPVRLYGIELDQETLSKKNQNISGSLSPHKSALNFLNSSSDNINFNDEKIHLYGNSNISPGKIKYDKFKQILKVQCADGKWIKCNQIKVSTTRIQSVVDFYNGFLSKKGSSDWFFTTLVHIYSVLKLLYSRNSLTHHIYRKLI